MFVGVALRKAFWKTGFPVWILIDFLDPMRFFYLKKVCVCVTEQKQKKLKRLYQV